MMRERKKAEESKVDDGMVVRVWSMCSAVIVPAD